MAREIDLKHPLSLGLTGADGQPKPGTYGDAILAVLRGTGAQGATPDEIIRAMEVLLPIKAAIEAGGASITLSETDWRTLRDKLNATRFIIATEDMAEFLKHVRDAPEIGT